jgi:hypothetical protein
MVDDQCRSVLGHEHWLSGFALRYRLDHLIDKHKLGSAESIAAGFDQDGTTSGDTTANSEKAAKYAAVITTETPFWHLRICFPRRFGTWIQC